MLPENNILDESKQLVMEQLESGMPSKRTNEEKVKWPEWKEPTRIGIIVREIVKGILTPREY
ncbi:MAG: hypothetical protein WC784_02585 [Candidatus Shapirobacteria bacterium]